MTSVAQDDDEVTIEQVIETLHYMAYYNAWVAGFLAGGGSLNDDLHTLANQDYQRAKDEWRGNLP